MKLLLPLCFSVSAVFAAEPNKLSAEALFSQGINATEARAQKRLIKQLAAEYPETPYGQFAQGMLRGMTFPAKPAEEIEFYNKAIKLKPDFAEAFSNRGTVKLQLQDIEGAMVDFNKAIEIQPSAYLPYFNRAVVKAAKGEDVAALADFDKTLSLKSDFAQGYYRRALHKIRLKKPKAEYCNDLIMAVELRLETAQDIYAGFCSDK